ncbi:hypothetical protein ACIBFB_27135 [Nocardiopsis sp. NPDC050513]|uniref:hypothetical protein n=1 Tax=Nocardiopsis sp. NPDC050513 TaxID=3364338 RepID=UPI003789CC5B
MRSEFTYTDGWHPTVNPSARMAVHHHRFVQLLDDHRGILNEVPRRKGGSTLRLTRFRSGVGVDAVDLPGTVPWVPWWLPASDAWAAGIVSGVYRAALDDPRPTVAEKVVYDRVRTRFDEGCAGSGGLTVGEVLHGVLDAEHRALDPDLPRLELVSLTRSPLRDIIAEALTDVPGGLEELLGKGARAQGRPLLGLGVATSPEGVPLNLRFRLSSRAMEVEPLDCDGTKRHRGKPRPVTTDEAADLIRHGRLVPGSRLMATAEVVMALGGRRVRHYGNTYGRLTEAAHHLGVAVDDLPAVFWPDDEDSWHYADLPSVGGGRYPLHLLDILTCSERARENVPHLITHSLRTGRPVRLEAKETLDASVSD